MKSVLVLMLVALMSSVACDRPAGSDEVQRRQQEVLLEEGTAQAGMPSIKNFRERKILKDIIEMRDANALATFTYLYSDMTGKFVFLGESIGFGIPAATQYTNPEKTIYHNGVATMPQADPNGLFSPSSAEGTWVLLKDPNSKDVKPVYIEPRIIVSPFRLEKVESPTPEGESLPQ